MVNENERQPVGVVFLTRAFNYYYQTVRSLQPILQDAKFFITDLVDDVLEKIACHNIRLVFVDHRYNGFLSEAISASKRIVEEDPSVVIIISVAKVRENKKEAYEAIREIAKACVEKITIKNEYAIRHIASLIKFFGEHERKRPLGDYLVKHCVITARQKEEVLRIQRYYNQPFAIALALGLISHEELLDSWHEFGQQPKLFVEYLERNGRATEAFRVAYRRCHLRFGDFLVDVLHWVDRDRLERIVATRNKEKMDESAPSEPVVLVREVTVETFCELVDQEKTETLEELLINSRIGSDEDRDQRWAIFFRAFHTGSQEVLQLLEMYRPGICSSVDPTGKNGIYYAIKQRPKMLDFLLTLGVSAHQVCERGEFPLLLAVRAGKKRIVHKLLCHVVDSLSPDQAVKVIEASLNLHALDPDGSIFTLLISHMSRFELLKSCIDENKVTCMQRILDEYPAISDAEDEWTELIRRATDFYRETENKGPLMTLHEHCEGL